MLQEIQLFVRSLDGEVFAIRCLIGSSRAEWWIR